MIVALIANLLVTAVPIGGGTISEMMILSMMGYPVAALPILTMVATIIGTCNCVKFCWRFGCINDGSKSCRR